MADSIPKSYHTDPTLYMYTSLTSGSSQIITATSRLQTILKANKIDFQALDTATDEKARMLWGRRRGTKKLPGLVRYGMVLGDIDDAEEWNEYGELKEHLEESAPAKPTPTPSTANTPSKPPVSTLAKSSSATPSKKEAALDDSKTTSTKNPEPAEASLTSTLRQAGLEAAKKATDAKSKARAEALEAAKKASSTLGVEKLEIGGASASKSSEGATESTANPTADSSTAPEVEVLEGSSQANPEEVIPNAKEAEERANQAIIEDESHHIHIAGSPPPVKRASLAQKARVEGDEDKAKHIEEASEKEFLESIEALSSRDTDNTPAKTEAKPDEVEKQDGGKDAADAQITKTSPKDADETPQTGASAGNPSKLTPVHESKEAEKADETGVDSTSTLAKQHPTSTSPPSKVTDAVESPHPQTKTQEQPAASGDLAGETVAD